MRWRSAYLFEYREKPFDLLTHAHSLEAAGLSLRNPSNGRLTRLSPEGDQIETNEMELADLISRNSEVPFQWWVDDSLDVFCQFEYLPRGVMRHYYGVEGLDEAQLARFSEVLIQLVVTAVPGLRAIGAVVEPLNYGDCDTAEWTAFFQRSGKLPMWPQLLVCHRELAGESLSWPAEYESSMIDSWTIWQYPDFLAHPLEDRKLGE